MRVIIIMLLLFPAMQISAQVSSRPEINLAEEMPIIAPHAQEEVGLFTQYLEDIANKRLTYEERQHYKDIALSLFVGSGRDYTEILLDNDGNALDTIIRKAPTIEITTIRQGRKRKMPVAQFLRGLADIRYRPITIQSEKCHYFVISEIKELETGSFEYIVNEEHVYVLKESGRVLEYVDRRKKKVTANFYPIIETTEEGTMILPLLGDITAVEHIRFE